MRPSLLYDPRQLCERLAELSIAQRRRASLRGTPAAWLTDDHIGSLELLRMIGPLAPQVIYDIGGNVGTWTLLAKSVYPRANVHAFEPLIAHHAGFERNTAGLAGVHLHRLALGQTAGLAPMHVTSFSDASSMLPLTAAGEQEWDIREVAREAVPVEQLDVWQQHGDRPAPSLIKLDVQGFELDVLRGASRCLDQADAVITEVCFREYYTGQCLFHDVTAFMAERGFRLFALGHGTAIDRPLSQTDALFVANRRWVDLPR